MFKTIHELDLVLVGHTVRPAEWGDELVGHSTDDMMPARAARASFGKQDKTGENPEADKKLINYLAEHKHLTPFEYQHATFLIECPLFIRSQIHRHRTFSYNEISRRYTSENLEFWIPDQLRGQAKNNKQASDGVVTEYVSAWQFESWQEDWDAHHTDAVALYDGLVGQGVAREIARAVLPQSLLTKFYMGGTLRNWAHFIELRRDEHAQFEVQVIANKVADELRKLWPESCKALGI